jgi:hypothetical protein
MNDTELTATVREAVAGVRSATPVDEIVSRGRQVRARRRLPVLAGTAVVAGAAALAVTAPLPGGHPASSSASPAGRPAAVRLAAWTVVRQANGQIDITIRQLLDPARLQATLRADGLPAVVAVPFHKYPDRPPLAACRIYNSPSRETLPSIVRWPHGVGGDALTVTPSALPKGTGMAIFDAAGKAILPHGNAKPVGRVAPKGVPLRGSVHSPYGGTGPLAVGLVYASQRCTG